MVCPVTGAPLPALEAEVDPLAQDVAGRSLQFDASLAIEQNQMRSHSNAFLRAGEINYRAAKARLEGPMHNAGNSSAFRSDNLAGASDGIQRQDAQMKPPGAVAPRGDGYRDVRPNRTRTDLLETDAATAGAIEGSSLGVENQIVSQGDRESDSL